MWNRTPRWFPNLFKNGRLQKSAKIQPSQQHHCERRPHAGPFVLAACCAFRRSSALLAAYPGPSSLSSSPRARTSLLTPTAIICHPVMSLLRSTLSSNTCAFTDDAGAGVPFGCIVTADDPGFPLVHPPLSRLPRLPSARLYVRYVRCGSPSMP